MSHELGHKCMNAPETDVFFFNSLYIETIVLETVVSFFGVISVIIPLLSYKK